MTKHVKPDWFFYEGGYTEVTICSECRATGMYIDCHPSDFCRFCGGKLEEDFSAIWIKPVYKFWFFGKIKDGYWRLKVD